MNIVEINVDLDGVLVDFEKTAFAIAGCRPSDNPADKKLRGDFWKRIGAHVRRGGKFFEEMDPMEDAFVLWNHLQTIAIPKVINSATGHIVGAAQEKRNWVRRHLGHEVADVARFVRAASDKAAFAGPGVILIDDRRKAIDPWVEAGGIGILHTSAASTIKQLKELGL